MSGYNPRKNVLERLREREKSRDWSKVNKSFPVSTTHRRWSAESYRGEKFASSWKPQSPQHLPKLENRPASVESSYDKDFKHGKHTVIPPLPVEQRFGGFGRDLQVKPKDERKEQTALFTHQGSYPHPTLSSYYPNPSIGPPPHPPLMYPIPMIPVHPGYAPWFPPFPGVNNAFPDGRHGRPTNQMSKSQAALILQKYTRGWQVRKGPKFALWRFMCNQKHSRRFVEALIASFLTEEIIPDLLIDVLSGTKFLSVQDPRYKASEILSEDIICQDITAFTHEIAIGMFYSQGGRSFGPGDPLLKVLSGIVNDVVKQSASQIVRSTIDEMVQSHMAVIKTGDWLEEFILEAIEPMLPRVVSDAMQQTKDDNLIIGIIDEVIQSQLRQTIIEACRDVAEGDRNKQIEKVSVYAEDHFLDALCLQHLSSQLAGDNLSLYFSDYTDQVLDGIICGLLTKQYLAVNDEVEATHSNSAITRFHEEVFCDLAMDVLMEELTAHLDEDIQELHESERERNTFDL